jgi:hypothetical protein
MIPRANADGTPSASPASGNASGLALGHLDYAPPAVSNCSPAIAPDKTRAPTPHHSPHRPPTAADAPAPTPWPADGELRFCHYTAPGLSPHRTATNSQTESAAKPGHSRSAPDMVCFSTGSPVMAAGKNFKAGSLRGNGRGHQSRRVPGSAPAAPVVATDQSGWLNVFSSACVTNCATF